MDDSLHGFSGFDADELGGEAAPDEFLSPTTLCTPTWLSSSRNGRRTAGETPTLDEVPGGVFSFDVGANKKPSPNSKRFSTDSVEI